MLGFKNDIQKYFNKIEESNNFENENLKNISEEELINNIKLEKNKYEKYRCKFFIAPTIIGFYSLYIIFARDNFIIPLFFFFILTINSLLKFKQVRYAIEKIEDRLNYLSKIHDKHFYLVTLFHNVENVRKMIKKDMQNYLLIAIFIIFVDIFLFFK